MTDKYIYFDNAATTMLEKDVLEAMTPYLTEYYGNASSIHKMGDIARTAVEDARKKVAAALGCEPAEIYFTGSGTEADNWAIIGAARKMQNKGKHIISTAIEHHAVLHTLNKLEKEGFEVTLLPVDEKGLMSIDMLRKAIRKDTILITVMTANNEIGTLMPIEEIGAVAKEKGILFHTDAVQAMCHIPVNVDKMNADYLSITAHKFGGPKGIGALYMRKGKTLSGLIVGGAQERNHRAGTENVAAIVGMGAAIEKGVKNLEENSRYVTELRDYLIENTLKKISDCTLNGDKEKRLPGNANFSIRYIEGEAILLSLSMKKICASSGSACTSGSLDPSHVLLAIGLPHEIAHGSLRISLSHHNTKQEIDYFLEVFPKIVENLRAMSPIYPGKGE